MLFLKGFLSVSSENVQGEMAKEAESVNMYNFVGTDFNNIDMVT